ncbi:SMP-30/gluconolactonase/LRE family protein [Thioalkalivibrio sp. XN279]|uniref:SMP-30/gluconolactonase/LRE family protein n=1 Tax=Thioalkalivibrio sp. XN279 TaxID=2714953 RepID=UPI00140E331E|nr:SMP-30/gluconolactonase/LRE family protein [Thioalkalivibrio sp. XN279]
MSHAGLLGRRPRLRRALKVLVAVVVLVLAYLLAWPTPLDPFAWQPPPDPGTGADSPFRPTQSMEGAQPLAETLIRARFLAAGSPENFGPEDIAISPRDGHIYTGIGDGSILRIEPESGAVEVFADTGGRPLGMGFDPSGERLYVADAERGLVAVGLDGRVTYLVDVVGGEPLTFADNLEVGPDGVVWFSAPTRDHTLEQVELDVWDSRPSGRLVRFDPASGEAKVVLDNLFYANGVALADDGAFVLVNEFLAFRIRRLWLTGPKAGAHDIFADGLPGYPDNITLTPSGTFLVGLSLARIPALDAQRDRPWAVKAIYRLPGFMKPPPQYPGYLLEFGADGRLLRMVADEKKGEVAQVTAGAVLPAASADDPVQVVMGSLLVPAVRKLQLDASR